MSTDLLEKLAELPVPPPPSQQKFDRAVHDRINSRLIVGQVIDFVLRGFAFATLHFFRAGRFRAAHADRKNGTSKKWKK